MRLNIFLAGATGAIGRRLCPLLVNDGHEVIGTTRHVEKIPMLQAMGIEPVVVDVFDRHRLIEILCEAQPTVVIHQLTDLPFGLNPAKMKVARIRNARVRDVGTQNLIAAASASGTRRMIVQSLAYLYAPGPLPHREDDPLNPDNPDLELTVRAVMSLEHQVTHAPMEGIILRYGRLYGPGTGFDSSAKAGPVLHVDAAADAARRAVTLGSPGMYNVAEGDGSVCIEKATSILRWDPTFRW